MPGVPTPCAVADRVEAAVTRLVWAVGVFVLALHVFGPTATGIAAAIIVFAWLVGDVRDRVRR